MSIFMVWKLCSISSCSCSVASQQQNVGSSNNQGSWHVYHIYIYKLIYMTPIQTRHYFGGKSHKLPVHLHCLISPTIASHLIMCVKTHPNLWTRHHHPSQLVASCASAWELWIKKRFNSSRSVKVSINCCGSWKRFRMTRSCLHHKKEAVDCQWFSQLNSQKKNSSEVKVLGRWRTKSKFLQQICTPKTTKTTNIITCQVSTSFPSHVC